MRQSFKILGPKQLQEVLYYRCKARIAFRTPNRINIRLMSNGKAYYTDFNKQKMSFEG